MKKLIFKHIFLIATVFFLVSYKSYGQEKLNINTVDKLSFEYYSQEKWDDLIKLGEESLFSGIDFYYLQYRLGIAYYNRKNYRKAISSFEKIVNQTPDNKLVKEYLYYSYLLGSRYTDANSILQTLDTLHQNRVAYYNTKSAINSIGVNYKYYLFDDFLVYDKTKTDSYQKVRNSMNYLSVSLLSVTNNASVFYVNFSLFKGESSIYESEEDFDIIDEDLKQTQLYLSWFKRLNKGLNMKLAFTFMKETLDWYDKNEKLDNAVTDNFIGLISITKSIKNVDLTLGSSISKINEVSQMQPYFEIDFYPFGNRKLYTSTSFIYQHNFDSQFNFDYPVKIDLNDAFVFKQLVGAQINDKLSADAFGMFGKVSNFVDNYGLSIYNNLDKINYWYGIDVNYYLTKKLSLYLNLRNDNQTNEYKELGKILEKKYNVKTAFVGFNYHF